MLTYVRRTGVPEDLEELVRPEGNGGRPRELRVDVLITAMLLTYAHSDSLLFTKIHHLLTEQLPRAVQGRYAICPHQGQPITVNQVRYLWNAIADRLDFTVTRHPELTPVERDLRREHTQAVMDRLTGAASMFLPAAQAYAVDLTAVDSASRARQYKNMDDAVRRARPGRSADPDARFGHRTRTFDNRSRFVFGYQMVAVVRTPKVDGPREPLLIDRISLVPGNENGVPETFDLLDRLTDEGRKPHEILADRGFTHSLPEKWASRLRERGIKQVLDMHPMGRGARLHPDHGYVMVDGWPHCPAMPTELVDIARPPSLSVGTKPAPNGRRRSEHAQDLQEWTAHKEALERARALIAERTQYRFERLGRTSAGNERFICPARAGKIVCHGCPLYARGVPTGTGLPEVTAPDPLPKACAQVSITIDTTVEEKLRQEHYWMSDDWIRSYARRSRVEAAFGLLKGTDTGGIRRGWTHQVGLVRTGLLLAIGVAATNLRQLLAWAKETGDSRDELVEHDITTYGFAEYDAEGNLPDAHGPPPAA